MSGTKNAVPSKSIPRVLAGSGRSGTTWVLDSLALANGLRPVFEPLHPQGCPRLGQYAWRRVEPGQPESDLEAQFKEVFFGQWANLWTDYRVRPDRLLPRPFKAGVPAGERFPLKRWAKLARHYRQFGAAMKRGERIVKLIRGNLLLGWLQRTFDARVVLLVRHPGAVAESQLRLGGTDWDPVSLLGNLRENIREGRSYGRILDSLTLETNLTEIQQSVLVWCLDNHLPMKEAVAAGCLVVHYEDLKAGSAAWEKVCAHLALTQVPSEFITRTPSQQASSLYLETPKEDKGGGTRWVHRLSAQQCTEAQEILDAVGVVCYRMDSEAPAVPAGDGQERASA